MKKVANEKNYKWKGMKDYEKIYKREIYSFSERVLGRAIRNWNQNLSRGGLLFCKIFRISTNDYDDRWNWKRIYICEVIHKCKFFLLTFVNFFTMKALTFVKIFTLKALTFVKIFTLKAFASWATWIFVAQVKIARHFVKTFTKIQKY